jgi:2,4-dienoyl-CoA reductase-like NADH-dependent reductase (Old Yellow Enzyme family)
MQIEGAPETAGRTAGVSVDPLFQPFEFGRVTLKNRVVMAPMTRSQSPGHVPGENVAEYYRRRAEGGVGLIITEGTVVGHPASNGYPDVPFSTERSAGRLEARGRGRHAKRAGASFRNCGIAAASARRGCLPIPRFPGYGPSRCRIPFTTSKGQVPHEMTQSDIEEAIEAFARSAAHAEALGFDGLEIHGAHSYLIDQFFWEVTNRVRTSTAGTWLRGRDSPWS